MERKTHAQEPQRDHRRARRLGRGARGSRQRARQPGRNSTSPTIKKDTDIACLYHCDFGDPQRFSQMLQNMLNHYSAYEFDTFKLKLVVVAHGAGIKFFLDDRTGTPWEKETIDPELYKRFVGLTKYGVEAYLCRSPTSASTSIRPRRARMRF